MLDEFPCGHFFDNFAPKSSLHEVEGGGEEGEAK